MNNGLDDVVAAETTLSDVDGLGGILIIRGRSLDELAGVVTYEELLALLLSDAFEDKFDADSLRTQIGLARQEVFRTVPDADTPLLKLPVTDAVRALTAQFADGDDFATALRLIAAPAVFTPAVIRLKKGQAPVAPDTSLGHAADILHMLHDRTITPQEAAALNTYLVTVSDHGMNASTFAARVVASTHAGLVSSVLSAFGALKGPLHGGAPGPVLDMLDAIGTPDNAEPWLEKALDDGERLMGFGHRIYRVRDPRADALMQALRRLAGTGNHGAGRFKLAESVEAAALRILARRKPDRPLKTNVEFYTALLLETLGFPRDSFTSVFAMGRVGGWIAHSREQTQHGRLIRPQSRYVGPRPIKAA